MLIIPINILTHKLSSNDSVTCDEVSLCGSVMKYTEGLVVVDLVEKTKGRWPKQVHVSVTTCLCERKDHLVGLVVFIYVLIVHMT